MCAQHITFHSSVDSSSSDMDLKSTKNHPNLHERPTYTTKSYAPSLECGPLHTKAVAGALPTYTGKLQLKI